VELRIYATAEVRKGGCVSKAPDLSAFPIPRKGGARPIELGDVAEPTAPLTAQDGEGPPTPAPMSTAVLARTPAADPQKKGAALAPVVDDMPTPTPSGQTVATTVKLDENRYLRLAEAGRPGPGRLKRRTIQDMVLEALDEWFEKRGL